MRSLLKEALKNEEFKKAYKFGIENGLIHPFDDCFFEKLKTIYVKSHDCSLYDYFEKGYHIGYCLPTAKALSKLFEEYNIEYTIYRGFLPAIKGTYRSLDGNHAWLVSKGHIYDTSLLLEIDERLSRYLGYEEEAPCCEKDLKTDNKKNKCN